MTPRFDAGRRRGNRSTSIGDPHPAFGHLLPIGSLKMMELRNRAQSALGDRFDIREFHEWILAQGSMPLGVLEAYVDEKIANVR